MCLKNDRNYFLCGVKLSSLPRQYTFKSFKKLSRFNCNLIRSRNVTYILLIFPEINLSFINKSH